MSSLADGPAGSAVNSTMVTGGVLEHNPALSVKAPRQKLGKGKTPVLTAEEAGELLRSIKTDDVPGLRGRALIGVMVFTFARVSAACGLNVADIFHQQRRLWVRPPRGGRQVPRNALPPHAGRLPLRVHRARPLGRGREGATISSHQWDRDHTRRGTGITAGTRGARDRSACVDPHHPALRSECIRSLGPWLGLSGALLTISNRTFGCSSPSRASSSSISISPRSRLEHDGILHSLQLPRSPSCACKRE